MDLATFVPKNILVCQLRQIGDVILMTPLLELLKKRYPDSAVHVLTEKKCLPVLENNPYCDRVWPIDKKDLSSLWKEVAYYRRVAAENFDLVVDLQQTPRCRWVVYFSKAPVRLTRTPPWYTRWLYTDWAEPEKCYASAMKAAVLGPLGITWQGERPLIVLTPGEKAAAKDHLAILGLSPGQTLVTVDPTHRRETRRWPARYYAELLEKAAAERPGLRFQLLFGPGEEAVVAEIAALSGKKDHLLPAGRLLSLREMAACIEASAMLLGNCSAPRHMAVAVGTPTLTIQGATSSGWVFPAPEHGYVASDIECRPCNKNSCDKGIACLTGLAPEAVLPEFLRRLDAARAGR
ncbi:Glycosyltransferase 9 family protein [uncultured delta proteobacterium]|uniref:Glycosyltransferase 9 family protein n=1 Tax=uncultured delta proteobacterium TaxID=34034 RepID=A0A212K0R1_9DELT|nr:Glycosyltransferase 9 family protein [uncultured delta proteobacterium]